MPWMWYLVEAHFAKKKDRKECKRCIHVNYDRKAPSRLAKILITSSIFICLAVIGVLVGI